LSAYIISDACEIAERRGHRVIVVQDNGDKYVMVESPSGSWWEDREHLVLSELVDDFGLLETFK
jgi:hypothetical protein